MFYYCVKDVCYLFIFKFNDKIVDEKNNRLFVFVISIERNDQWCIYLQILKKRNCLIES